MRAVLLAAHRKIDEEDVLTALEYDGPSYIHTYIHTYTHTYTEMRAVLLAAHRKIDEEDVLTALEYDGHSFSNVHPEDGQQHEFDAQDTGDREDVCVQDEPVVA